MIIGIIGYACSGKSTAAEVLRTELNTQLGIKELAPGVFAVSSSDPSRKVLIQPLAGPMKDACRVLFGFTDAQLYGDQKEVVDSRWGKTPRWVLQYMGTEFLRQHFGADFHIKCPNGPIVRAREGHNVIVPDVRFPNEAEAVKSLGGQLIKIVGRGGASGGIEGHASEAHIDLMAADHVVPNTETLEAFEARIRELAQEVV